MDELNFTILLDERLVKEFLPFRDFFSLPSLGKPYGINKFLSMDATGDAIMASYLKDTNREDGEDTIYSKLAKSS